MGDTPARSWLDREPKKKRGPGRPSNLDKQADVHARALYEFNRIQATMRDSRLQCLQDRRFYSVAGAQWEGPLQDQFANKPRFEANLIQLAIIKIFNEYRNNRIAVDFVPKDGAEDNKLADTCDGLYRADEQDSVAEEAHDNGFDEACGGGFGAWRLVTAYEDEDNPDKEKQRIRIEPIFDADSSVFFDLNAKRQDKADAKKCYVLYSMTRQAYIDTWNDDPASWPKIVHQYEFDWATPDVVFVCEYYEVETKTETVFTYENLDGETEEYTQAEFEEDTDLREALEALGSREIEQKKRRTRKVHKYIFSGSKILEDCGYIAGKCIPIVPMYGKRWFVDNVERCSGVTRIPKDMQRLLNMQLSKLGEISALSSVEKPILTPEQIQGFTELWANDNPYLLLNPITGPNGEKLTQGPIGYTKPPAIPPATAALVQGTTDLIRELLGNQQNAEEMVSNISGKAVELIQHKIDMQSYIYMSNMAKAIKREGEIWLSMAKETMVKEGRKMKTVTAQGKTGQVTLMQPMQTERGVETQNDLSKADFDVTASVGPTSQSRKAATVRALTGLLAITEAPEDKQVLTGLILMNMEGEGLDPVNEYYRKKMLRLGVITPTPEEAQELAEEMANQQPSPEQKYLDAEAEKATAQAKESTARTVKTLADADLSTAKADEATANAAKAIASIGLEESAQALEAARTASTERT
jgi:hypothetical protein